MYFWWGFLFILFVLQFRVWIISNYTAHKHWKKIFIPEILILWLTFNPGLALTGFRSTRYALSNNVERNVVFKAVLRRNNENAIVRSLPCPEVNNLTTSENVLMCVFRWFDGFNWEGLKQRKLQAPIIPKVCLTLAVTFLVVWSQCSNFTTVIKVSIR